MYACMCVSVCVCLCMYVWVCVRVCMSHTNTNTYTRTHTYTRAHTGAKNPSGAGGDKPSLSQAEQREPEGGSGTALPSGEGSDVTNFMRALNLVGAEPATGGVAAAVVPSFKTVHVSEGMGVFARKNVFCIRRCNKC